MSASRPSSRVGVSKLTLTNFRNYERARLACDLRPVVLTGANGSGKTNLLEALSLLTPGRGLRRAKLSDITRQTPTAADGWAVAVDIETAHGPVALGIGCELGDTNRRVSYINGRPVRVHSELAAVASVIWLTPTMERMFIGPAAARRYFLDRLTLGFYPDHGACLSAYERVRRGRARLLRDGMASGAQQRAWRAGLEQTMAAYGTAAAAARRDAIARLSTALRAPCGPFPRAEVTISGYVEHLLDTQSALAAEDALRTRLAAARDWANDREEGPHRSDLIVHHAGANRPAAHCSTGEQKALLLSILLAQARMQEQQRGTAPLLLLDEAAAHLDNNRRHALYEILTGLGAQSWLTGADRFLFESFGDRAQFFQVVDGCLR